LDRRLGIGRSTLKDWIIKQQWQRNEVLRWYDGADGQKAFQSAVRAAIKAAFERKIIAALEQTLLMLPPGNPTNPPQSGKPAAIRQNPGRRRRRRLGAAGGSGGTAR
jgi:hypothetical protein